MRADEKILALDATALGQRLRARELSPVEVAQAYLARIEATEPRLNAYITVTAETALEQARAAEREIAAGRWRGPFHGVPVALKDLLYTKGIRTTGGSKVLDDFVPDFDATAWARLKAAGAVLLGKLNMHEFAMGGTSDNPHYGTVHNPYDTRRIPGGSSGGSAAAVVAKSALATLGTDTLGSIRLPAALCGCVGLKPTYGRVSRFGVIADGYSLDHVGPITRSVRDAALMLNVIAGHDPNDATSSHRPVPDFTAGLDANLRGIRVGVLRELTDWVDADIAAGFDRAIAILAGLGARIEPVSVPALHLGLAATFVIARAEGLDYHGGWLGERQDRYGQATRRLLEGAMTIPALAYIRACKARAAIAREVERALDGRSALVAPTTAIAAPEIGQETVAAPDGSRAPVVKKLVPLTAPFDATGHPALAVPSGVTPAGLPLSIQIIGRAFDEASVLSLGHAFEAARGPMPEPAI